MDDWGRQTGESLAYGQTMPHVDCSANSKRVFYHDFVFVWIKCHVYVEDMRFLQMCKIGIITEISTFPLLVAVSFMIIPCTVSCI